MSTINLGVPATALMVKEDHSLLGVGTAGGQTLRRLAARAACSSGRGGSMCG